MGGGTGLHLGQVMTSSGFEYGAIREKSREKTADPSPAKDQPAPIGIDMKLTADQTDRACGCCTANVRRRAGDAVRACHSTGGRLAFALEVKGAGSRGAVAGHGFYRPDVCATKCLGGERASGGAAGGRQADQAPLVRQAFVCAVVGGPARAGGKLGCAVAR